MLTKEQAALLRRSVKGVIPASLQNAEQDIMLYLMDMQYCAADCKRDADAVFATQLGLSALAEYDRDRRKPRTDKWFQALLVLLGSAATLLIQWLMSMF